MVQDVVVTIDALVHSDVLPLWQAVLGYQVRADAPEEELNDSHRQLPVVYFQQMEMRRPQRNRIHLDIFVPHDQASARVEAASRQAAASSQTRTRPSRGFWPMPKATKHASWGRTGWYDQAG
ncbi:hypothetical protein GCM10009616_37750 [Microlunatus lacustris]